MSGRFLLLLVLFDATFGDREAIFKALERALTSKSSNLLKLYTLLYPPDYIQTNTVSVVIRPCNFTVGSITHPEYVESESRPAFWNCSSCGINYVQNSPQYCLNTPKLIMKGDQMIQLFLYDESESNSHSQLVNFISSRYLSVYVMMNEYVSFALLNILPI